MSRFRPEPPHTHGTAPRTGVLLVNLGTPEAPTRASLRRYLKEFLSDDRVVELPRALWWLVLHGIILNLRPRKSAQKYEAVWTDEGSPLKVHLERQAKLLRGYLGERDHGAVLVACAMRYGSPSVAQTLEELKAGNCTRILVLPLYPQYASSTTGSVFDVVAGAMLRWRNVPELRLVRDYHDAPGYIAALAGSVREHWMAFGEPEQLVMSFHGVPRFHLDRGDPYHCQCQKTGRLLAEALHLPADRYRITFQSRFGRARWLQPYTLPTLQALARAGTRRVDLICPGFSADCLETLEEIAMENRAAFLEAGGREFRYIPCLNERADWMAALTDLVEAHLGNWLGLPTPDAAALRASAERARAMGALR